MLDGQISSNARGAGIVLQNEGLLATLPPRQTEGTLGHVATPPARTRASWPPCQPARQNEGPLASFLATLPSGTAFPESANILTILEAPFGGRGYSVSIWASLVNERLIAGHWRCQAKFP